MLQLDTRPPWTSSPPAFHAKAAAESVFSRLSRSAVMGSVICMSENALFAVPPASSRSRGVVSASGDTAAEDPSCHETAARAGAGPADSETASVVVTGCDAGSDAGSDAGKQLNVSRTITNAGEGGRDGRSGTLQPAPPANTANTNTASNAHKSEDEELVSAVGLAGRPLKLPPIQPASSAAVSDSSERASSLLPSISEPHPPAFRGRASSPSASSVSSSALTTPTTSTSFSTSSINFSPTDNTPANGTKPAPAARGQSPSPSLSASASLPTPPPRQPANLPSPPLVKPVSPPRPFSVLSSDPIETDSDAAAAAAAVLDRCLPPPPDNPADSRTSRKRTLQEFQGDLGSKLPSIACGRFSPSAAFGGISNPSRSQAPKDLPAVAPAGPILASKHLLPGPPSEISDLKFTVYSGDQVDQTRPHNDSPANPTLVLAHRAVAAIRSQSLPRSKTIGPLIAAGKSNLYPFSILRKVHDGVMETEDESDTDSVATTISGGQRVMPWHKRRGLSREDSPNLSEPWAGADPAPLLGPMRRKSSTPKPEHHNPGLFGLIQQMGNNRYRNLAEEVDCQPIDASENGDQRIDKTSEGSRSPDKADSGVNNASSTNLGSQSSFPAMRPGAGGSGDGDEDPNKRSRKLSEHEEDNDPDIDYPNRNKRRRLGFEEFNGQLESQSKIQADQDAVVSSLFSLSKGPSPPPLLSGPPTFDSLPSTATTMDTGPTYSETVATPATLSEVRSEYKSPVETTPNNTLPPMIHTGPNHLSGKSPTSPRTTHAILPGVSSLLTAAEMKHSMDSPPPINSHHPHPGGGQLSKLKRVQHLNVAVASASSPTPSLPRNYIDEYSRPAHFTDSVSQYRAPRTRLSPTISPTEKKLPPIAPAPPKFSGRASSSPSSKYASIPPYFPPRNLNRPEHATLPPIKTEWSTPIPHSEPNSAKTPTSKISKRGRNGTPKHGSGDSSQSSPSVAGGFKCTEEGCTAAPFSTQYLLNSHANVHSEDRPHFCPVPGCSRAEGGKGFKRKNEMIRHGLVHQSPGYACPFCPDKEHKYPRPDNLQRHVKAHHKDKSSDDPMLREVLAVRPEGGQRGRRRRLGPST
ncbi:hypothetical protein TWF696_001613 [Orbilia brochopaga]|uniref:C2H2-type domain-containing protein n=1 Tax=Orbilia brochopaga TaxID=3140254 RepID=A0AAV9U972_9PEZI